MTADRITTRLRMRPVAGYGASADDAAMLDRALVSNPASAGVLALKVPFESDTGPVILSRVRALSITETGTRSVPLSATAPDMRAALGAIFFSFVDDTKVLRVGPRRPSTPKPICYLMSHGIVMVHGQILQSGIVPNFVAETLRETSLLMLGRSASSHDRLIFTAQARDLLSREAALGGYGHIEFEFDYAATA